MNWGGVAGAFAECGDSSGVAVGLRAALGDVGVPTGFLENGLGALNEVQENAGFLKALYVGFVVSNVVAVCFIAGDILVD